MSRFSHRRFPALLLISLLLGPLLTLPAAPSVRAAGTTYYVGTGNDDNGTNTAHCADSGNVDCSLRSAIYAATSGSDTITWIPNVTGLLVLTQGTLPLANSVTIQGPGPGLEQVSGGGAVMIFAVGSGTTVSISGLTIEYGHGDSAGGIYNNGALTLSNVTLANNTATGSSYTGGGVFNIGAGNLTVRASTFTNNSSKNGAGGIDNFSTLNVSDSTFTNNTGGAILNGAHATATILTSTISGNSASYAAGIANGGTLTVTNSTISGNTAQNDGGGISDVDGTESIVNSTIANNAAARGGGLSVFFGSMTVTGSTVANNSATEGGGIYIDAAGNPSGSFQTTLLANSAGGNCGGPVAVVSNDYNLASDISCALRGAHDLTGVNLGLDAAGLRLNGGQNQTIALAPNSPAIDAGGPCPTGVTADQRFQPRVGACDIGAYEYQPVTPTITGGLASAAGGPVTVRGAGFQSGSQLAIGGTTINIPSSAVSADGTQFSATVPAHSAGKATVTVTNPGVPAGTGNLTYQTVLTSLNATSGGTAGGVLVTLAGAGFVAGKTSVTFGTTPVTVKDVAATAVTVMAPAHAVGTVDVTVTVDGVSATITGAYTYRTPNTLPSPVSPGSGLGNPSTLPGSRPTGSSPASPASGSPKPLPTGR